MNAIDKEGPKKLMKKEARSVQFFKQIPDNGVVNGKNLEDEPGRARVVQGKIVTVVSIDMYKVCCNCNAKIVDTGIIATCGKYNTKLVSKVPKSKYGNNYCIRQEAQSHSIQ